MAQPAVPTRGVGTARVSAPPPWVALVTHSWAGWARSAQPRLVSIVEKSCEFDGQVRSFIE